MTMTSMSGSLCVNVIYNDNQDCCARRHRRPFHILCSARRAGEAIRITIVTVIRFGLTLTESLCCMGVVLFSCTPTRSIHTGALIEPLLLLLFAGHHAHRHAERVGFRR